MRKLLYKSGAGIGLALLSSTAFAATQEELLEHIPLTFTRTQHA